MILDASILSSMYKGEKIVKKGWKNLSQNYGKSVEYSQLGS